MIRAGSASPDAPSAAGAASLVFIGGGPRAALILERLAAGISSGRFRAPLQIHGVEPHKIGRAHV